MYRRNSLAALGFANRFESRRVALKPRTLPDSKCRRSGSCLRFCAADRCRHDVRGNAVATAEKPKSSKINERCMRQGTGEKKVGHQGPRSMFDLHASWGFIEEIVSGNTLAPSWLFSGRRPRAVIRSMLSVYGNTITGFIMPPSHFCLILVPIFLSFFTKFFFRTVCCHLSVNSVTTNGAISLPEKRPIILIVQRRALHLWHLLKELRSDALV